MFRSQTAALLIAASVLPALAAAQTPADIARLQGAGAATSTSAGPYAVAFTGFTPADFARGLALGAPRSRTHGPAHGAANAGAFAGADIARLRAAPGQAPAPAPLTLLATK